MPQILKRLIPLMKKHTSWGVMALGLLAAAGAAGQAKAGNILINPGFETGSLAPWFANSGTPMVTDRDAHTGRFSVSAFRIDEIRQNFAPVASAAITEVSFYAKRQGGPFNAYQFFYSDSPSEVFFPVQGTSNNFTFFNVTSGLNLSKSLTGFGVFGTSGTNGTGGTDPGPALLDDFTINVAGVVVVPEPSTMAAAGLGLIFTALALVRHLRNRVTA